jgi:hypothetical protein
MNAGGYFSHYADFEERKWEKKEVSLGRDKVGS